MSALHELRDRFLAAQLKGDRSLAARIVLEEGLAAGHSVSDLQDHVLRFAQHEIGRLWQENRVSIAQEHMATAIAGLVLTQLFERAPTVPRNARQVIVACVEGELHEFPSRLVADALDLAGFGVRYLGANVPLVSLLDMVDSQRPDLVALSATMSFHAPALRSAVGELRARFGERPLLAAGGGALTWTPSLRGELDVDIFAETASQLVTDAKRLLEVQ